MSTIQRNKKKATVLLAALAVLVIAFGVDALFYENRVVNIISSIFYVSALVVVIGCVVIDVIDIIRDVRNSNS